jgi:hypothetical protein
MSWRATVWLAVLVCACGGGPSDVGANDADASEAMADDGGGPAPADVGEGDAAESAGADAAPGGESDAGPDAPDAVAHDAGAPDAVEPDGSDGESGQEPGPLLVGEDACCLVSSGARVAWIDGGDVWLWDERTGQAEQVVAHPATQKDVALAGDLLVWADDRDGGFDLWAMDLAERVPRALVVAPGDQDQAVLDPAGSVLVWIGREKPPHTAKEGDVWALDLTDPEATPRRLTDDVAEQGHPHVEGGRVVWSDFSADPDGVYLPVSDPSENNGDILGWDLEVDEAFVVTMDPSKQLRPAIDGANVVWLDWRGINPEPKYSEFQLYATELGSGVETLIAWSAWNRPELWQRPAILEGTVAFIAEPGDSTFQSGVFVTDLAAAQPELVISSEGFLEAVALREGGAVLWLGGGALGVTAEAF